MENCICYPSQFVNISVTWIKVKNDTPKQILLVAAGEDNNGNTVSANNDLIKSGETKWFWYKDETEKFYLDFENVNVQINPAVQNDFVIKYDINRGYYLYEPVARAAFV